MLSVTSVDLTSDVDVAKWSTKCALSVSDGDIRLSNISQGHVVVKCRISRGRLVQKSESTSDYVGPVLEVLILPCPPGTIDHRVMKPKGRIGWQTVEAPAGVTPQV